MPKKLTAAQVTALGHELVDYLCQNHLEDDTYLYLCNQRWGFNDKGRQSQTPAGTVYHITDDVDVTAQLEYANPDTVTMTFEGPLYMAINYSGSGRTQTALDKIAQKYGLYWEQGYAWSMATYPD